MSVSLWQYLWAAPNSALGVILAATALGTGEIRVVDGVLEAHGTVLAFLLHRCTLLPGGASAITFGHVVLGRDEEALRVSRAHERVHVRQYERWGPFFIPAYLAASLWAFLTGTGAYDGNWFEREARRES